MSLAPQNRRPFNVDLSRENKYEYFGARSEKYGGYCNVVSIFLKKILDWNRQVCWSIVVKEKLFVFHFFGTFASNRIPIALKGVSLPLLIHSFTPCSNSRKLYLRIPVNYANEFQEVFKLPLISHMIAVSNNFFLNKGLSFQWLDYTNCILDMEKDRDKKISVLTSLARSW